MKSFTTLCNLVGQQWAFWHWCGCDGHAETCTWTLTCNASTYFSLPWGVFVDKNKTVTFYRRNLVFNHTAELCFCEGGFKCTCQQQSYSCCHLVLMNIYESRWQPLLLNIFNDFLEVKTLEWHFPFFIRIIGHIANQYVHSRHYSQTLDVCE